MINRPKPGIIPVDYHLEYSMEARFSKTRRKEVLT
jgi:hypothetical protein